MSEPGMVSIHIIGRMPDSGDAFIWAIDPNLDVTDVRIQKAMQTFCKEEHGAEPVGVIRVARYDGELKCFHSYFEEPPMLQQQSIMDSAITYVMIGGDGKIENRDDAVLMVDNVLLAHKIEQMFGGHA
jgi:hypothetical protein